MKGAAALIPVLGAALVAAAAPPAWRWDLPAGVAPPHVPADNAMSAAKVALGRRLFYDADLSDNGTMACATCHEQHRGFTEGNRMHPGVHGELPKRNVPGLADIAWLPVLTAGDPRVRSLEAQATIPMFGHDPVEMGGSPTEIPKRLSADDCYRRMFADAFPDGRIDMPNVARALAAFERTMISYRAPVDAWRSGDRSALGPDAKRGAALFTRDCASCHAGMIGSDARYHAIEPWREGDAGLAEVTHRVTDRGKFRTPTLRNVSVTGPWLHDGSASTLGEAIDRHRAIRLDPATRAALVAYLAGFTDEHFLHDPALSLPDEACGKKL